MICVGSTPIYRIKYFETLEFDRYSDFLMCFLTNSNQHLLFKECRGNVDYTWIEKMGVTLEIQEVARDEEIEWEQFVEKRKVFTTPSWHHPFYNTEQRDVIFFSPKDRLEIQQTLRKKHDLVNDTCIVWEAGRRLEEWTYILTFAEHVFDEDDEDNEYWAVFVQEKNPNQFTEEVLPVLKEKFQVTE